MRPIQTPTLAVVLVNLGTPDSPTAPAVRQYLRQFLSDTRVIEIPKIIWFFILNMLVLPLRAKRVAHAYASIWQGDSPMRSILDSQAKQLAQALSSTSLQSTIVVRSAMTYGNPSLTSVLNDLSAQGVEHIVVLPLFPQYSATSTGAVYDTVCRWIGKTRNLPSINIIKDYFAHPDYIAALAESVKRFQKVHGQADKLLMSFHGLPQACVDKGDPYARRCLCTAAQVAATLGLSESQWAVSFQSRFGKQEWIKPYTDKVLEQWAAEGVESIQVISPAFSADCLETLEELAIVNRKNFLALGGKKYDYIPALNTDSMHIDLFKNLVMPVLQGFESMLKGWY